MKRLSLVTRRYEELILTDNDDREDIDDVWRYCLNDLSYQDQRVKEIWRREDLPKDFEDGSLPLSMRSDLTVTEVFEVMAKEAWERRRAVHVITSADVGEELFGHEVIDQDVGRVVYLVDKDHVMENDEQRQTRRANVGDREMAKSILLEKLLAKQAEVTGIMEEIAGL